MKNENEIVLFEAKDGVITLLRPTHQKLLLPADAR